MDKLQVGDRVRYIGSPEWQGIVGIVEQCHQIPDLGGYRLLIVNCDRNDRGVQELSGAERFFEKE